ncbi:MAG: hypothetical protein JWQ09_168 [Segetibacter sp.]|nr:hypothetical protein [Segetibacter sp.]
MAELIMEQSPLFIQIIREVEKLDDEEKKKLLMQLRKDEILNKARNSDSIAGTVKANALTDDETDKYLSDQRKLRYEQSKA